MCTKEFEADYKGLFFVCIRNTLSHFFAFINYLIYYLIFSIVLV